MQVNPNGAKFQESFSGVADDVWKDRRAFLSGGLKAERIEFVGTTVLIYSRAMSGSAACPRCGGFQRRQQTNGMVQRMADEGIPIKLIERATGLSRGLVRRTCVVNATMSSGCARTV